METFSFHLCGSLGTILHIVRKCKSELPSQKKVFNISNVFIHWPTKLQKVMKALRWGVKATKNFIISIKICNNTAVYHFKYLSSGIAVYISCFKISICDLCTIFDLIFIKVYNIGYLNTKKNFLNDTMYAA